MTEKQRREAEAELTAEEVEQQKGEELPDREAMSILPIVDPVGGPVPLEEDLNQRPR